MAAKSMEKRLENLERENKELVQEIERLQAVNEIQNLISRYQYLHTAECHQEILELWAKKAPDVRAEYSGGVYEGYEGIRRFFVGVHTEGGEKASIGRFGVLPTTTPCIEVAKDGKTAKGLWIVTGFELHAGARFPDNKPKARHAYGKYGIDFIKEDGKWKFWHLHFFPYIHAFWDENPHDEFERPDDEVQGGAPDHLKPDRPPTYTWRYSQTGKTENIPPPPEPYATWDERTSMTTFGIFGYKPKYEE